METVGHNVSTFVLWFITVLGGLLNFDLPIGIKFGQLIFTPLLLVMLFYMIFAFFGIDMPVFHRDAAIKAGHEARGFANSFFTRFNNRSKQSTALTVADPVVRTDNVEFHVFDRDGTRIL